MENLDKIKDRVEKTKDSYRAIAKDYNTSHTQIANFVKKYNWNTSHRNSKKVSNLQEKKHEKILGKTALRKMDEIKNELGNQYSPTDEPMIIMVAKSYEEYLYLAEQVQIEGYTLRSLKTGGTYLNPTFNAYQAVQKNLITVSNQLGLSISARKKLGLKFDRPGQEQKSIFNVVAELNMDDEDLNDI